MREGRFALITPVMTFTDGRWGGDDDVDAGGTRQLGQPRDQGLDFRWRHHHQVREFVDDGHDVMHVVGDFEFLAVDDVERGLGFRCRRGFRISGISFGC